MLSLFLSSFLMTFLIKTITTKFNVIAELYSDDFTLALSLNNNPIGAELDTSLECEFQKFEFEADFDDTFTIQISNTGYNGGIIGTITYLDTSFYTNSTLSWTTNLDKGHKLYITEGSLVLNQILLGTDTLGEMSFSFILPIIKAEDIIETLENVTGSKAVSIRPNIKFWDAQYDESNTKFFINEINGTDYSWTMQGSPVMEQASINWSDIQDLEFTSWGGNDRFVTINYYISSSESPDKRWSNYARIIFAVCKNIASTSCVFDPLYYDQKLTVLSGVKPSYPSCNSDYYHYWKIGNECKHINNTANQLYLDANNIFQLCGSQCQTCEKQGAYLFHNCLTCKAGYYPCDIYPQGNCYKTMSTSNFEFNAEDQMFHLVNKYYYIQGNGDRILVDDCSSTAYPYLTPYRQCVKNCKDWNLVLYNDICFEECPKYNEVGEPFLEVVEETGICSYSQMFTGGADPNGELRTDVSIEDFMNTIDDNIFIYKGYGEGDDPDNKSDITSIIGKDFILQIYPSNVETKQEKVTTISLGECENLLRDAYDIPGDELLYIAKFDIFFENALTTQVEYAVYDSKGVKLDLKYCSEVKITVSTPIINKENANYDLALTLNNKGIDIYNPEDDFYNNICNPYDNGDHDMILSDRRNDIFQNISLCEIGCDYLSVDFTTNKVNCSCSVKDCLSWEEKEKQEQHFLNDLIGSTNIVIFKCVNWVLNIDQFKDNNGFWIFIVGEVIICIFFVIIYSWSLKTLTGKLNFKHPNPPIKKSSNRAVNPSISSGKQIHNINDNLSIKSNSKTTSIEGIIMSKEHERTIPFGEYSGRRIFNQKNSLTQFKIGDIRVQKTSIDEDTRGYSFLQEFKKSVENNFNTSPNPFPIFWFSFVSKVDILAILISPSLYVITPLNISALIFSIWIEFFINALVFSDDIVSKKYKGELTFFNTLIWSAISTILGNVLSYVSMKILSDYDYCFELIVKEIRNEKQYLPVIRRYWKIIKIRISLFLIFQLICVSVFGYYTTVFCIVYKRSQGKWWEDCWLGLVISLGESVVTSIIIAAVRSIAIYRKSKYLYNASLYLGGKI